MQVYIPGRESLIEWLEDPSYPNTTLSWNIISRSSMIEQEIKKTATYFITVGNLNSEAVKAQLNFNLGQAKVEDDWLQARQGGYGAGETGQEAHDPLLSPKDNDHST
ncbi:hypothetical protein Nepgr_003298 [Nepenthes gracilis]|uniref:Uncharacterized protein n=1 Tax=Nepenthes gracilis TaxID=150966 RepID=A0AAD3RZC8_NEPGR|nr:hypothetical protein Nepgr_003298 [Nepenthes gracilis]